MAKKRKVGNLLALAVLSYLTMGPKHPYELSRTLRDNGDDRSIRFNHGSLYMVIQQLDKAGFVAEQETTREGQRPERTVYAITDAGRSELHDWLRELVGEPDHEYPHFVAALSLIAALPPDEAVALLRQRLLRLGELREQTRTMVAGALTNGLHPLFLVEEDYRATLLDAEAAFVERFIGQITDPDTGWGPQWAAFHTGQKGYES
ncbi:PadR family transcriptional regulator [Asanoa ishikariensis]|uniref:Transcriptional regulator PadR-like family protein n=1 Tax=Asanoa ishikariensis TaxID=137265 RepID=A0A1H3MK05_9ACTN|nr:PadR family transcriptional regulator [Asanoa ishikariensis]GIF66178.1 PadR family transcriptional regulator [Asanoa ishikariensis]SDY76930.1 Transcriptional regulator PadR-like family protein [Asanoa ishikariensis]